MASRNWFEGGHHYTGKAAAQADALDGENVEQLIRYVHGGSVGHDVVFRTPFGERMGIYCDSTASGRALSFVEDYLRSEVLPSYANTHTSASQTGFQTTLLRNEARAMVENAVGATDKDLVLFCGSGATGAVQKLVHLLGVRERAMHAKLAALAEGASGTPAPDALKEAVQSLTQLAPPPPDDSDDEDAPEQYKPSGQTPASMAGSLPGRAKPAWTSPSDANVTLEASSGAPLVLVGPYAHHSSILPWREAGAQIEILPESGEAAGVDMQILRARLEGVRAAEGEAAAGDARRLILGVFTAASNVTGLKQDTAAISQLLHEFNALAIWDFAAAAPHAPMNVNSGRGFNAERNRAAAGAATAAAGRSSGVWSMDAAYFSPHKFHGGVGTPGVLVVKKRLLRNLSPSTPGGGTVFFVQRDGSPTYLGNLEEREEGGTPDIVGSIRCGLTMHLHSSVGPRRIELRERSHMARALRAFRAHPNIAVLGDDARGLGLADRVCILSLAFPVGRRRGVSGLGVAGGRRLLHPVLVASLLSDLFGVQTRAGCLCAGPYALRLLGLSAEAARALEERLVDREELLRPGFVRLSLPYHLPRPVVDFVIRAVCWVASRGVELLSRYRPVPDTGEWKFVRRGHGAGTALRPRSWLHSVSFASGELRVAREDNPGRPEGAAALPSVATAGPVTVAVSAAEKAAETQRRRLERLGRKRRRMRNKDAQRRATTADLGEPDHRASGLGRAAVLAPVIATTDPVDTHSRRRAEAAEEAAGEEEEAEGAGEQDEPMSDQPAGGESQRVARRYPLAEAAVTESDEALTARFAGLMRSAESAAGEAASVAAAARAAGHGLRGEELAGSLLSEDAQARRWFVLWGDELEVADLAGAEAALEGYSWAEAIADAEAAEARGTGRRAGEAEAATAAAGAKATAEAEAAAPAASAPAAGQAADQAPSVLSAQPVWHTPPPKLMAKVKQAVSDYGMIRPGDRVMLGLSGGKDSMTLLHLLEHFRRKSPFYFELGACTMDPQSSSFDPSPLKDYCAALGVPYFYESQPIMQLATQVMQNDSICAFCSRMKRGILYGACRREGYNVLVLAQHLDDLSESFVMSAFNNGLLRTMKAHYANAEGDLRIARPLVYVRERQMREWANTMSLPIIDDNCPACFTSPTERYRCKMFLRAQEQLNPGLFHSLLRAMRPLMLDKSGPRLLREGKMTRELRRAAGREKGRVVQFARKNGGKVPEDAIEKSRAIMQPNVEAARALQEPAAAAAAAEVAAGTPDADEEEGEGTAASPSGKRARRDPAAAGGGGAEKVVAASTSGAGVVIAGKVMLDVNGLGTSVAAMNSAPHDDDEDF